MKPFAEKLLRPADGAASPLSYQAPHTRLRGSGRAKLASTFVVAIIGALALAAFVGIIALTFLEWNSNFDERFFAPMIILAIVAGGALIASAIKLYELWSRCDVVDPTRREP